MPTIRTDADPTDALVLVAFQSTGAASPIAAEYLAQHLNMPQVGDIQLEGFEALIQVQDGRPSSPIRIRGGDVACEVDGPCRRTYVVSSDVPIPAESIVAVAAAIHDWAKGARLILGLDAVVRDAHDDTPDIYHIAVDDVAAKRIEACKAPPLGKAIMSGMIAALLGNAKAPTGALVVEARKDHPDGRAAAALVTALDPLIPQIAIDAEPLLKDALALESQIQNAVEQAERNQPKRASHTFI